MEKWTDGFKRWKTWPLIGVSSDVNLTVITFGYSLEGGYYFNRQDGSEFVSQGLTFGLEASVGFNFIIIVPKSQFEFSDLKGMGLGGVFNIPGTPFSVSVFGNSSPDYPTNTAFDTYYGFKIGFGFGFGGSYTPESNTSFKKWIPDYSETKWIH